GVIGSGAGAELQALAERLQAPIFTTVLGKGAVRDDHPLAAGATLLLPYARAFLAESDVMLAVGTRFTEEESDRWGLRLPESLIHIEIDPEEIDRNYPATVGVLGDARSALQLINEKLRDVRGREKGIAAGIAEMRQKVWGYCQERAPEGVELVQTLRKALPRETIIVSDLTVAAYWCRRLLDIYEPRTNIYPWGFCTLGFGLPAAIGAKVAKPERPVVVLCGDGGFLFNCQELAAAVQLGLPIVTLVFNDSAYGVLRPQQEARYGAAHEVDLVNPDFMGLAGAFGVDGCRVESIEQLGPAVTRAIEADRSALIELPGKLPWPIMEPSARMFEADQ
ncbi:MAG: thiamine pyrophosphate-binding protein, partial [Caldilineaceae bacterium SB0662_bin_25]|nr:thiamine pyrophosphate-binding protein [Caldilineaceae bacterium SB0662_bin_25]